MDRKHELKRLLALLSLPLSNVSVDHSKPQDLYRVNFEVNNLKPFACLAFPQTTYLKTPRKRPIFGDELVTSFLFLRRKGRLTSALQDKGRICYPCPVYGRTHGS